MLFSYGAFFVTPQIDTARAGLLSSLLREVSSQGGHPALSPSHHRMRTYEKQPLKPN